MRELQQMADDIAVENQNPAGEMESLKDDIKSVMDKVIAIYDRLENMKNVKIEPAEDEPAEDEPAEDEPAKDEPAEDDQQKKVRINNGN